MRVRKEHTFRDCSVVLFALWEVLKISVVLFALWEVLKIPS
jgi:hypothetical protein